MLKKFFCKRVHRCFKVLRSCFSKPVKQLKHSRHDINLLKIATNQKDKETVDLTFVNQESAIGDSSGFQQTLVCSNTLLECNLSQITSQEYDDDETLALLIADIVDNLISRVDDAFIITCESFYTETQSSQCLNTPFPSEATISLSSKTSPINVSLEGIGDDTENATASSSFISDGEMSKIQLDVKGLNENVYFLNSGDNTCKQCDSFNENDIKQLGSGNKDPSVKGEPSNVFLKSNSSETENEVFTFTKSVTENICINILGHNLHHEVNTREGSHSFKDTDKFLHGYESKCLAHIIESKEETPLECALDVKISTGGQNYEKLKSEENNAGDKSEEYVNLSRLSGLGDHNFEDILNQVDSNSFTVLNLYEEFNQNEREEGEANATTRQEIVAPQILNDDSNRADTCIPNKLIDNLINYSSDSIKEGFVLEDEVLQTPDNVKTDTSKIEIKPDNENNSCSLSPDVINGNIESSNLLLDKCLLNEGNSMVVDNENETFTCQIQRMPSSLALDNCVSENLSTNKVSGAIFEVKPPSIEDNLLNLKECLPPNLVSSSPGEESTFPFVIDDRNSTNENGAKSDTTPLSNKPSNEIIKNITSVENVMNINHGSIENMAELFCCPSLMNLDNNINPLSTIPNSINKGEIPQTNNSTLGEIPLDNLECTKIDNSSSNIYLLPSPVLLEDCDIPENSLTKVEEIKISTYEDEKIPATCELLDSNPSLTKVDNDFSQNVCKTVFNVEAIESENSSTPNINFEDNFNGFDSEDDFLENLNPVIDKDNAAPQDLLEEVSHFSHFDKDLTQIKEKDNLIQENQKSKVEQSIFTCRNKKLEIQNPTLNDIFHGDIIDTEDITMIFPEVVDIESRDKSNDDVTFDSDLREYRPFNYNWLNRNESNSSISESEAIYPTRVQSTLNGDDEGSIENIVHNSNEINSITEEQNSSPDTCAQTGISSEVTDTENFKEINNKQCNSEDESKGNNEHLGQGEFENLTEKLKNKIDNEEIENTNFQDVHFTLEEFKHSRCLEIDHITDVINQFCTIVEETTEQNSKHYNSNEPSHLESVENPLSFIAESRDTNALEEDNLTEVSNQGSIAKETVIDQSSQTYKTSAFKFFDKLRDADCLEIEQTNEIDNQMSKIDETFEDHSNTYKGSDDAPSEFALNPDSFVEKSEYTECLESDNLTEVINKWPITEQQSQIYTENNTSNLELRDVSYLEIGQITEVNEFPIIVEETFEPNANIYNRIENSALEFVENPSSFIEASRDIDCLENCNLDEVINQWPKMEESLSEQPLKDYNENNSTNLELPEITNIIGSSLIFEGLKDVSYLEIEQINDVINQFLVGTHDQSKLYNENETFALENVENPSSFIEEYRDNDCLESRNLTEIVMAEECTSEQSPYNTSYLKFSENNETIISPPLLEELKDAISSEIEKITEVNNEFSVLQETFQSHSKIYNGNEDSVLEFAETPSNLIEKSENLTEFINEWPIVEESSKVYDESNTLILELEGKVVPSSNSEGGASWLETEKITEVNIEETPEQHSKLYNGDEILEFTGDPASFVEEPTNTNCIESDNFTGVAIHLPIEEECTSDQPSKDCAVNNTSTLESVDVITIAPSLDFKDLRDASCLEIEQTATELNNQFSSTVEETFEQHSKLYDGTEISALEYAENSALEYAENSAFVEEPKYTNSMQDDSFTGVTTDLPIEEEFTSDRPAKDYSENSNSHLLLADDTEIASSSVYKDLIDASCLIIEKTATEVNNQFFTFIQETSEQHSKCYDEHEISTLECAGNENPAFVEEPKYTNSIEGDSFTGITTALPIEEEFTPDVPSKDYNENCAFPIVSADDTEIASCLVFKDLIDASCLEIEQITEVNQFPMMAEQTSEQHSYGYNKKESTGLDVEEVGAVNELKSVSNKNLSKLSDNENQNESSQDPIDSEQSDTNNLSSTQNTNNLDSTQNTNNLSSTQKMNNLDSTQNTNNLSSTQKMNNLSSTQNTNNLDSTQNTNNLSSTQKMNNLSSTHNTNNLSNTQNSKNLSNTQNTKNWSSTQNNKRKRKKTSHNQEMAVPQEQINNNQSGKSYKLDAVKNIPAINNKEAKLNKGNHTNQNKPINKQTKTGVKKNVSQETSSIVHEQIKNNEIDKSQKSHVVKEFQKNTNKGTKLERDIHSPNQNPAKLNAKEVVGTLNQESSFNKKRRMRQRKNKQNIQESEDEKTKTFQQCSSYQAPNPASALKTTTEPSQTPKRKRARKKPQTNVSN